MENEEITTPASGVQKEEVKLETPETPVEGEAGATEEHIDYKRELEKERERNERLSKEIGKKNEKLARAYERKEVNEEEEHDRQEELLKRLEERFEERLQGATKSMNEQYARDMATQMAGGNAELGELTYLKYKNRIVPSGNLRDDMEEAFFLATGKKFQYEAAEARRAAVSKGEKGDGRGAGQKAKQEQNVEITPEEMKMAQKFGLTIEELKKGKLAG